MGPVWRTYFESGGGSDVSTPTNPIFGVSTFITALLSFHRTPVFTVIIRRGGVGPRRVAVTAEADFV
jgi:hypothetical protein